MPVEKEEFRFSLLSLRTFLQGLPTAVAYPCAFSQSVFTLWLSSSHQISHFWSSLGHHGHCCVFGLVWGFLGPRVSRVPFSAVPSLLRAVSHARAAAVRPRLRAMCCEAATLTAPPSSPAASYGRRCHHVSSFTNATPLSEKYSLQKQRNTFDNIWEIHLTCSSSSVASLPPH